MKRYDNYKPSGIEWIGDIPSHWEFMRLKFCAKTVLGKMLMSLPPKDNIGEYSEEKYLKSKNVGVLHLELSDVESMWFNSFEKKLYLLKEGDIVMNEGGDIGKCALWRKQEYDCYIQNSVHKISTNDNVHNRFLLYYLNFVSCSRYLWSIVSQISIAHLTKDKLNNIPCVLPPYDEQYHIADYLDMKCAEIDKSIASQQRRIELLEELKQSVITQAVTRGLDPNVPLRDSGINWIGQIPEHWKRLRLKHTALQEGGMFIDGDWIESKDISSEGVKYLTSGNVGVIKYKEQGSGFITDETFNRLECKNVYPGDILISRLNEPISRACLVPELNSRIVTCVDNVIYRPDNNIFEYRFIVYVLNNYYYTEYVNLIARGATMHRIARLTLGGISIPVPSKDEQQAIADYLDKRCAEIDGMIEREKKRIELMQELKQSIITEVVTGKRKVM